MLQWIDLNVFLNWIHADLFADDDLALVIQTFATSYLDYSKAIYLSLKITVLSKLQLSQNAAVHLITKTGNHEDIRPVLCISIEYQVKFKALVLILKVRHALGPGYPKDHWKLQDEDSGQQLCCSGTIKLSTARLNLISAGCEIHSHRI